MFEYEQYLPKHYAFASIDRNQDICKSAKVYKYTHDMNAFKAKVNALWPFYVL